MVFKLLIFNYFFYILFIYYINVVNGRKTFLFSVIISIYNSGKYLQESINSIINQTMDFNNNIQLILVNDGSIDISEEICLKYLEKYPKNIVYLYKDNGGVSSARNLGLKYAKGKYINYLDSDDKWSNNSFELVSSFFDSHPDIDIIAGRIKYFEGRENYHCLDYKFKETRIIDLRKDYNYIHISAASSFFRAKAFYGKKFVEGLSPGEDKLYVNNYLLEKPLYGVIRDALYFFRQRNEETSIKQISKYNDIYYFTNLNLVDHQLLNKSLILYNKTLPFIQYTIAYEALSRIETGSYKYICLSKLIKYFQIIIELLKRIDDKYIIEQKIANYETKFYSLFKKKGIDIRKDIIFDNGKLRYKNNIILDPITSRSVITILFIEIKSKFLQIELKDNFWLKKESYYFFCKIGKEIIFPQYINYKHFDLKIMFGKIIKKRIVKFTIPIKKKYLNQQITFHLSYMNKSFEILPTFGYFAHIPPINNSYYANENFILIYQNLKFKLIKNNIEARVNLEKNYCKELSNISKNYLVEIRGKAIKYKEKIKNKRIWLVNDRANKAGDNGEYFYRFLIKKNSQDIISYFVIQENCSDYKRLRKLGNILLLGSESYNETFLNADKIISSSSNYWVINPFGRDRKYLIDLIHFDFIFLQHGVTKDDVSNCLNRFELNISIIITVSQYEYNSFLDKDYAYSENNIKLTGFSRYDNLPFENYTNNTKKIILIIPTWRSTIKGTIDKKTCQSIYTDNFKKSEFFNFYNNLINSPRLLETMEKYNYKGIFCLHPIYIEQWKDFKKNSIFSVKKFYKHQNLLIKSSLLITDYSSVFFDFSYMKKPVIYTQFDYEQYRISQYKKGYFDYRVNGFGPICTDLENCVDKIITEIKNGCKINNKYLERIYDFFKFFDNHNNERIYQAILHQSLEYKIQRIENIKYIIIIAIFINSIFISKKIKEYFIGFGMNS